MMVFFIHCEAVRHLLVGNIEYGITQQKFLNFVVGYIEFLKKFLNLKKLSHTQENYLSINIYN